MKQLKSDMKNTWSQTKELDDQINQQVNSDNMDTSVLNGLVDQKTKLIGDSMKLRLNAQNQVRAILTTEQKEILRTKLQAFEEQIGAKFKSCHAED